MSGKEDTGVLRNIELIVARKGDFLHAVMEVVDERTKNLTVYERRGLRDAVAEVIATLDLKLFLTLEEVKRKELDSSVSLDDLDRRAIWESLRGEIAKRFPKIAEHTR